ncbi:MAG: hypothetical protein PF541_13545 [Prolixibacteraceae bacterium]|jgi:hypothetical protein|nr:hypothetical protein [Prolixibacteraceae bacterium]
MTRKKKHSIPLQLIELEDMSFHILIETEFQNNRKGKWAIDTGASKTVFDSNETSLFQFTESNEDEIQSAGIGEMQIETQTGILPLVKIDSLKLIDWPVALIDLQYVNKLYSQFTNESIIGLLGSDFLVKYNAVIDYKKLTLSFTS